MTSPKPKGPYDWAIDAGKGAAVAFGTAIFAKSGEKFLNKSTEMVTQKEDITKIEIYQKVPVEISVMQPVEVSLKNCVKVDLDVKAAALVGAGVAGGII